MEAWESLSYSRVGNEHSARADFVVSNHAGEDDRHIYGSVKGMDSEAAEGFNGCKVSYYFTHILDYIPLFRLMFTSQDI